MTQSFHREYAKCVRTFCKSVPPALKVTTEEMFCGNAFSAAVAEPWAGNHLRANSLYV